jgi:oligopeptide/dipeptide ABC transporter ATP-binding protein
MSEARIIDEAVGAAFSRIEARQLSVQLPVEGHMQTVLHDVSLTLRAGDAVGLVGESGSGKSMTARALSRLLPPGAIINGEVLFEGQPVYSMNQAELRNFRSSGVAIVFQDPRSHINPVRTIGDFLTEGMRVNQGLTRQAADKRAIKLLSDVGIADGVRRLRQYPHELSGGLLQRVMIAAILAARPKVILADEPTTALDVTTQAEVMAILDELRHEYQLSLLFITHDLDLASAVCDRTIVMYAGSVVEEQQAEDLYTRPLHPYTAALAHARPSISTTLRRLNAVPGRPLSAFQAPAGCAFAPRCRYAVTACTGDTPPLRAVGSGLTRCLRTEEIMEALPRDWAAE